MLMQELALDAVTTVMAEASTGQREIDIKKYVKIEKIPGGAIEDCRWNALIIHSFHAFGLTTEQPLSTLSFSGSKCLAWTFQHSLSFRSCFCNDLHSFVTEC